MKGTSSRRYFALRSLIASRSSSPFSDLVLIAIDSDCAVLEVVESGSSCGVVDESGVELDESSVQLAQGRDE